MGVLKRNLDRPPMAASNSTFCIFWFWGIFGGLHLTKTRFRSKAKFRVLHQMGSDGKFYTQDQAAKSCYARERCIRVVPECDLPVTPRSWLVGLRQLSSAPVPTHRAQMSESLNPLDPTRRRGLQVPSTYSLGDGMTFPRRYITSRRRKQGKQWDLQPANPGPL